MAPTPSYIPNGHGRQPPFTPTALEFTPKAIEAKQDVLNSCFITQTIPNVHRYAGIIGLCTVPEEKAGMDDLGWHIADFLAFRALLCGNNNPRAQSWLALCDIPTLVEGNPDCYVHGKDRRLVGPAARPKRRETSTGLAEREDNIQVETSPKALKEKFVTQVKAKMEVVKRYEYPLLIIICGLTSLEQDIYFGKLDIDHRYTLKDLRCDLGDGIDHIEATVITPSLFSAGWQVNTSFGRLGSAEVRGNWSDFLARQFGGLFAQNIVRDFLGWKCPVLDESKVDDSRVKRERFPGPACPSDEVKILISELKIKIQSYLLGGLSAYPMDHSFSFDKSKDEWKIMIGHRERPLDYQSLDWYERKWAELSLAQTLETTGECLAFLGNAFGGTRTSQLNHIAYLIEESYLAWPDHWASNFGQETKKDFDHFMSIQRPDNLDCHEIFNVLEHRARTSILADTIVQYFDLPLPRNERCRDCDNLKWKQALSETDRSSLLKYFGTVLVSVPGPNVPPGVNPNNLSKLQRRLESGAGYVRASLGIRLLTSKASSEAAIDRIESFLKEIERKQAELLASSSEIYQMCCSWLDAINIPVRKLDNAVAAIKYPQGTVIPEDTIGILDGDDEYDVYQEEDGHLGSTQSFTQVDNSREEFTRDQQLSFTSSVSLAPVQKQQTFVVERPENAATSPGLDAAVSFPGEVVDFEAQETRLIMELNTTKDRAKRARLTTELLELLQSYENLTRSVKGSSDVAQGGALEGADDDSISTISFGAAEERAAREKEEEKLLEQQRVEMARIREQREKEQQEVLEKAALQARIEAEVKARIKEQEEKKLQEAAGSVALQTKGEELAKARRKTPPHLRGIRGGRRS
ncbi:hypothetical protein GQX73_g5015 [Xylaria multiplex]|uniref:Uncharacterized protein n=1 Tax=Xylaria multiplex TaxID=323545 RepID=A0A7C8IX73_9PEZI|nr:hypothetical protein GQX73_g5015 [Xylaria multiplex]